MEVGTKVERREEKKQAEKLLCKLCSISKSTDSSHLSSGLEYFQNIHPVSFLICTR